MAIDEWHSARFLLNSVSYDGKAWYIASRGLVVPCTYTFLVESNCAQARCVIILFCLRSIRVNTVYGFYYIRFCLICYHLISKLNNAIIFNETFGEWHNFYIILCKNYVTPPNLPHDPMLSHYSDITFLITDLGRFSHLLILIHVPLPLAVQDLEVFIAAKC